VGLVPNPLNLEDGCGGLPTGVVVVVVVAAREDGCGLRSKATGVVVVESSSLVSSCTVEVCENRDAGWGLRAEKG